MGAKDQLQLVIKDLVASFDLKVKNAEKNLNGAIELDPNGNLEFTGFVRVVRLAKDLMDRHRQRRKEQDLTRVTSFKESELIGLRQVFMHRDLNKYGELPFSEFQLVLADLVPLKIQHIEELNSIFENITHKASADFAEFAMIWDALLKEDFLGLANLGQSADAT